MNFCSDCGEKVSLKTPGNDNRPRYICDVCDMVHYTNPKNVAGAILYQDDKVLLCKRAIEPRYGFWTLPAGFMENDETVKQGAARETVEEAQAKAKSLSLFGLFSLPHISQVYMMYVGEYDGNGYAAGPESLEVGLFSKDEIPWDDLAFPVVKYCLEKYFKEGVTKGKVFEASVKRLKDKKIQIIEEV